MYVSLACGCTVELIRRRWQPYLQYPSYADFAYTWPSTRPTPTPPIITQQTYESMKRAIPKCQSLIEKCTKDTSQCNRALDFCETKLGNPIFDQGYNY